jgi:hypothetical protein
MLLSSPGSQLHLLLTLLKARLSVRCEVSIATRARDTLLIVLRYLVCLSDGMAAGVTLVKTAFFKPVIHRNARIKDEALALPPRF